MSDWWEQPYKTGTPVKVKGFPRPLYPPDASMYGKKPSADGPDVIAYKRTICRAGRWGDWDPVEWDDTYSNAFALGKPGTSGAVKWTGVAGVQRQQDIDDTGWLGSATFQQLRSIRVPEGPHKGEPAMDARAVALVNNAYDLYGGHEPVPPGIDTVRMSALKRARTQLGVKESPPNTNRVKYTDWYGVVGPWCAMFVTWSYELGAADVHKQAPSFVRGSRYAYVPYIVGDSRALRNGLKTVDDPIPGDLVCYDWEPGLGGVFDHVGIFEKWNAGGASFDAIEGNTSLGNDSNGGAVMRRTRNVVKSGTLFVRVAEP
jgi:hypothetical protein